MSREDNKRGVFIIVLLLIFMAGVFIGATLFILWRDANNHNGLISYFKSSLQVKGTQKNFLPDRNKFLLEDFSSKLHQQKTKKQKPSSSLPPVFMDKALYISRDDVVIFKEDVEWESPKDLGDLGLTSEKMYKGCVERGVSGVEELYLCPKEMKGSSSGVKYIRVGRIRKGRFRDREILIIKTGFEESLIDDDLVMALRKGSDIIFLLEGNNAKYLAKILGKYFDQGGYKIWAMSGIYFEDLDAPRVIRDKKTGAKFVKDKYAKLFFDKTNLQVAFQHPLYGTIWMTKPGIELQPAHFELNSKIDYDPKNKKLIKKYSDIFQRGGFYLKLPNGLAVAYKLIPDIVGTQERAAILDVTWNGGIKNDVAYEWYPSGCGGSLYIYDETGKFNLDKDLEIVGRTGKGKPVYGYANIFNEDFDRLYSDIYQVKKGEKKENKEKFLAMHPKIFWVDPFGRLLFFYRTDIIPMAECGKPVIYLYPPRPMKINVQVKPNGGISKSEPHYKQGGWNLLAKPDGTLIIREKKYPYLFWEGYSNVFYQQPKRGWVVKKDALDQFFNDKLKRLGLIEKEIKDFKDFWLPQMTKNNKPYYFVTFLPQRKIDQIAPLYITPKPDTVIRVMMDYQELNHRENVIGFQIKTPERKGFVVVEWGGRLK